MNKIQPNELPPATSAHGSKRCRCYYGDYPLLDLRTPYYPQRKRLQILNASHNDNFPPTDPDDFTAIAKRTDTVRQRTGQPFFRGYSLSEAGVVRILHVPIQNYAFIK